MTPADPMAFGNSTSDRQMLEGTKAAGEMNRHWWVRCERMTL